MEEKMETSKVSVRIYGTDYNIAGAKSEEDIRRVAEYVDGKMREIAAATKLPVSALAVLTAVNATDDYFSREDEITELKHRNYKLEQDVEKMNSLWEEAKQSQARHQEELDRLNSEKNELAGSLSEKEKELEDLRLMAKGLEQKLIDAENAVTTGSEAKVKELETAIFDLEMENVQLKSELGRLKR